MSLLDEVDSQCQPAKASTNNQDVDFEIRGVLSDSHSNDEGELFGECDFIRDIRLSLSISEPVCNNRGGADHSQSGPFGIQPPDGIQGRIPKGKPHAYA